MDFFKHVELVPPDPILGLNLAFLADERENKINLGVGVYRTADQKPYILHTVKKSEELLVKEEKSKDYLPIDGERDYIEKVKELVFGHDAALERIYGAQSVGGTGALHVGGKFIKNLGLSRLYLSDPTWDNHRRLFEQLGFSVDFYPYYQYDTHRFNCENMVEKLSEIPRSSVIVLHASCHNPTGADPSEEEWEKICQVIVEQGHFPFFDLAYQGMGRGLKEDTFALRLFNKKRIQYAVAVSHAKNFGLYAERAGILYFCCFDANEAKNVGSQIKVVIRGIYSNPPCHGARIIRTILHDETLRTEWERELRDMNVRIYKMREALVSTLQRKSHTHRFDYLTSQWGMFAYLGLQKEQVEKLRNEFAIYMTQEGRINLAGLNEKNLDLVAAALTAVVV